jgi:hypothetical protein
MVITETVDTEYEDQSKITKLLVEPLEWAGFVYQGAALVQTALVNPFALDDRVLIIALGVFHVGLGIYVRLTKGPLLRGGPWMAAWVASAFAMPIVIALLAAPHTYASDSSCVQGCTYITPPFLFVGLCPWIFGRTLKRPVFEAGLLLALCIEYLGLVYSINGTLTPTTAESVGSAMLWVLVAFGLGKVIGRLTGVVRRTEADIRRQKNNQFFDFLHSHIKAGLAAVRFEQPNVTAMLEKIEELEIVVSDERIDTLLSQDQVPLALLCSERIRTFSGLITIAETPRSGSRTVPSEVGRLLNRALGDLLKNAVDAHASTIWITLEVAQRQFFLSVSDDGPGFDDAVLSAPSTSLYRLRQRAHELGGELERRPRLPHGSQMVMSVPEFPGRKSKKGS